MIDFRAAARLTAPTFFALALAICAAFSASPCTAEDNAPGKDYALVWSDEFDGGGLPDPARWSFETEGNAWRWGNGEDQFFTDSRTENARRENGCLAITAQKENFEGFKYTSARISTQNKGDWLYGRIEVRAKLPSGRGIWPAIWIMPTDSEYGGWPMSGEIDIMEYFGFDADNVQNNLHTEDFNHRKGTGRGAKYAAPDARSGFHTYALDWTKDALVFSYDGKITFTCARDSDKTSVWPFNRPFYLILNCSVGGDYARTKGGIDDSIFPQEFLVDWVRVWQRDNGEAKTVRCAESEHGTASIEPAKDSWKTGDRATATATPGDGYRFDGWSGSRVTSVNPLSFTVSGNVALEPHFAPAGELVTNGDFSRGLAAWNCWAAEGAVTARMSARDSAFTAKMEQTGKEDWQAQIMQPIPLERGASYSVKFRAKTDGKRELTLRLARNYPPYDSFLIRKFATGKEWKDFEFVFDMKKESEPRSRVEIDFGTAGGAVSLDGISVTKE